MMTKPLRQPAAHALSWLVELVAYQKGYHLRGVVGWATAAQIEAGVHAWGTSEVMRGEARAGRVAQEDVRAPGQRAPRWVYRVSQLGVDCLAEAVGVCAARIPGPTLPREDRVLVPEGAEAALRGLLACRCGRPSPRGAAAGFPGWSTSREIKAALEADGRAAPHGWFLTEDLAWLVRYGFAEECAVGRTRRYRMTELGSVLQPLEWVGPDSA